MNLPVRSYARQNRELLDAFMRYLVARNMSAATMRSYRDSVGRFIDLLGPKSLAQGDRTDIRTLQAQLIEKGLSHSSLDVHTAALRCLYKFLKLAEVMTKDPTLLLAHRKPQKRIPRTLTKEEIERLIAACESPFERALIETLYATGMRISEARHMRVEDVDFAHRVMRVKNGKGGKDRIVLFGEKCAEALNAYLGERKTGFLFETAPIEDVLIYADKKQWLASFWDSATRRRQVYLGTRKSIADEQAARQVFERSFQPQPGKPPHPYTRENLAKVVHGVAVRAGLRGVHPHAFRRAFATHLLQSGADLRAIQELMGHALVTTTQLYTRLTADDIKRAHEKFHPHEQESENEGKEPQD